MRTLQEKYNAIQEGKFSKEHFLAEARMQQPQLITRFNGYDDAVQILKNRGMIAEAYSAEEGFKEYSNDALADMIINLSKYEDNENSIARVKAELERRKQAVKEDYSRILELPDGDYFAIDGDWEDEYQGNSGLFFTVKGNSVYDKNGEAIQSSPKEFISQFTPKEILKVANVNEAKQTKLTKKSLAELERRKSTVAEISSDTFKSAVDVARGRGEDKRASKLGSTFLNSFVGKPLMGGTVSRIGIQKPSFADYFDVTLEVLVPTQGTDGMYNKPKFIYYDVENDDWNMKGKGLEVSRQDARVLSQIATKVNPDTKYRQGTQHFDIVGMSEARLNNKNLTDYRYKVTNEMDKYPYEQILRGLRVELEGLGVLGTPTAEEYAKALAKVSKNLAKDSIFYTNQLAGVNPKVDLHDKMVDATAKNTVDTFNGMKKAELKEGFKKLIKKVLSEEVIDVESYKEEEDEIYEMYGEDSVDEATDTEADKAMVRKLMAMYETDPSKFERTHKQAQVQAATTTDIKFKHLASLFNRAKAGALQRSTPEIPGFEGTRDALDNLFESKLLKDLI